MPQIVMAALVAAIHVDAAATALESETPDLQHLHPHSQGGGLRATWMPGTSPGMTAKGKPELASKSNLACRSVWYSRSDMRPWINLRRDLKRLSDAELARRLDEAFQAFDEASKAMQPLRLLGSWRGPIAHPLAYKLISIVEMRRRYWLFWDIGIAFWLSFNNWLWREEQLYQVMRAHLAKCEASDLLDEVSKRVALRGGV
jgi:hypothetical protein